MEPGHGMRCRGEALSKVRACVLGRPVRSSPSHQGSTGLSRTPSGTCDTACVTPACRSSVPVAFGNGDRYSASLNIQVPRSHTTDGDCLMTI
jgi:hypothetical protein